MKAVVHINHLAHQVTHGDAVRAGLERHGIEVEFASTNEPRDCDFAVIWGWKQHAVIDAGRPVLVMERGYIGDRMAYTSMGWNGLDGRALFPHATDPTRLDDLWPGVVRIHPFIFRSCVVKLFIVIIIRTLVIEFGWFFHILSISFFI